MTENVHRKITNVKDIVLPITMIGGLLALAFHGGVQYSRVNYLESTNQKVVATLEKISDELTYIKTTVAIHESQYPIVKKGS